NYPALLETYEKAAQIAREEHVPVVIHVEEVTQPQGHSTSGSHERYKSEERLEWEKEYCCINQMRHWMIENEIADARELDLIEEEAKKTVKEAQKTAWESYTEELTQERDEALVLLRELADESSDSDSIQESAARLEKYKVPFRKDTMKAVRKALRLSRGESLNAKQALFSWIDKREKENYSHYHSNLYSESELSPLHVKEIKPGYADDSEMVDGRIVLRDNFEALFENYPELLAFGEDTGRLGDVNKGMEGLQEKFGELRVSDTGIREATILGQGIGLALRGLRPIAEIQYLDYLVYCFQALIDDLATLHYRSAGGQKAPVIVRTRGHRLEGIWHTGSPMGMIVNGVRGIHVCVPRNMTEAAGMYNTILRGDDPALIIEPLNGYRIKERRPSNLGAFTVPLGIPQIVSEGDDITLVSYGSTFNICESVLPELEEADISVELIDVRTLLPFDRENIILKSLKKTNRILFVDEDVPGGATAYMMHRVIDEEGGYYYLDSEPQCVTAQDHRTPFGSDGDYFCKPNAEDIFDAAYALMSEANPRRYPPIYV
ncbi:MAG: transketolase C-terminal domain-containing protein, partial [Balneolaceae bacterium]